MNAGAWLPDWTAVFANAAQAFLGLASGLAVGSGLVAFLVVLDVIPRLAQITGTSSRGADLETAVVAGAVVFTCAGLFQWSVPGPGWTLLFIGLLTGGFVGTMAAALTEVLNVFPILARRLRLDGRIQWLLAAMVIGKVMGSLFEWLVFRIHYWK
jgi:stage V sporulation protein AB